MAVPARLLCARSGHCCIHAKAEVARPAAWPFVAVLPGTRRRTALGDPAPPASVVLAGQRRVDAQLAEPHALLEEVGSECLVERLGRLPGKRRVDPAEGDVASPGGMLPALERQER